MSGPTFVHVGYQCKSCGRTSVDKFDCNCIAASVNREEISKVIEAHDRAHASGLVTGTSNWAAAIARAFTKRQTAKISPFEQDAMSIAMVAAWSVGGRTDAVNPDFQCGFEAGWEAKPPQVLTNITPEFLAREAGFRDGYSRGYDAAMAIKSR